MEWISTRLCMKIHLLVSAQEAFFRKETVDKEKWLKYQDLLIQAKRTIDCRGI